MLDATTRILLEKYQPSNPLLQQISRTDAVGVVKGADGNNIISVVMSSADYPEAQILKACCEFNKAYPERMSYSYQLPVTLYGIPSGSWVFVTPEGGIE